MSVFVYDATGLLEERPESAWKVTGQEVFAYNRENPQLPRKLFVGAHFPPAGFVLDTQTGDLRPQTLQESLDAGQIVLPPGFRILSGQRGQVIVSPSQKLDGSGEIVEKSIQEKIADGVLIFDAQRQKMVGNEIIPRTRQELVNGGMFTLAQVRDEELNRLRSSVEVHLATTRTTNGYRLDALSRQKAAVSLQFRALPESDPTKADLLARKVIYPDNITDEILAGVENTQLAYDQAKAAILQAFTENRSVAHFEAIELANYLPA